MSLSLPGDPVRADLHSHTHYSRDSILSPRGLVEQCRRRGITCIAVTDHDTVRGGLAVQQLADFCVIVGEEVRTAEGEILGLFLLADIPRGLSAAETIDRIESQGGIAGVPHPFDRFRSSLRHDVLNRLVGRVRFLEALNARIVFPSHNKMALEFAQKHDLPISAASDAHSRREVGRCYVEMPPFASSSDFVDSLRLGRLVGRPSSPLVHIMSRYATLRHRLGWRPA